MMVSRALLTEAASPRTIFADRERWRWPETVFWLAALSIVWLFPEYLTLASQVVISGLFALSLDLLLGYTGMAALGHAAFFGIGAYAAGLLGKHGWHEPLSGLVVAGLIAGAVGFVCSLVVARLQSIALLMVTLGIGVMLHEGANQAQDLTGGDDGLQGVVISPVLGLFDWDIFGRTAFLYSLTIAFVCFLVARRLVNSPFGLSLRGIKENARRVPALGIRTRSRVIAIFTISATLAGIAGGVLAQTTQFVGLEVLSFDRSAGVLIMLVLGGAGTLYGAFVGAALFMIAKDFLSASDPVYWYFWIGLLLCIVVAFGRGGVVGVTCRLWAAASRRRGAK
jgi:branched-chain amino acid transport system permease protein